MFETKYVLKIIGKESFLEWYQDICRIYLDEYQEERNLFMENRFLRRK